MSAQRGMRTLVGRWSLPLVRSNLEMSEGLIPEKRLDFNRLRKSVLNRPSPDIARSIFLVSDFATSVGKPRHSGQRFEGRDRRDPT